MNWLYFFITLAIGAVIGFTLAAIMATANITELEALYEEQRRINEQLLANMEDDNR